MKVLIVGGANQGKRVWAGRAYQLTESDFAAGGRAVDALHLLVRERMRRGGDPDALLAELDTRPGWVILCDEVGCGVIPVDAFDRRWREAVGRLCCELAARADIVERVSCGIPLRLKG